VAAVPARRLQHVSVQVPAQRLEECARFYAEVLGMERIPNLAGAAWFRFGDGDHVHLLEGPGAAQSSAHMALVVDDLEATLERARAHGAEPRQSDDLWGAPRWFLRDPAGNRVEIFPRPPA
jgi:catechol 2,3-dioxygenase-like lactoylglutathione lyase family enzyme